MRQCQNLRHEVLIRNTPNPKFPMFSVAESVAADGEERWQARLALLSGVPRFAQLAQT